MCESNRCKKISFGLDCEKMREMSPKGIKTGGGKFYARSSYKIKSTDLPPCHRHLYPKFCDSNKMEINIYNRPEEGDQSSCRQLCSVSLSGTQAGGAAPPFCTYRPALGQALFLPPQRQGKESSQKLYTHYFTQLLRLYWSTHV